MQRRHTPRAVLFDLDDTLFDHRRGARRALAAVHDAHEAFARWPFEDFERAHAEILETLHIRVVAGTIGIDEAREERFRQLYELTGIRADAALLTSTAARYRAAYVSTRDPVPGARALLAELKPRVAIGIVSNNLLEEQREKIRACGFEPYIDVLVVSEAEEISKPDPEIFRRALERLHCDAADAVMIGDSWKADVEGARAAGIRAIWLNHTSATPPEPLDDVSMITALDPIGPVLEAIFPCVLA